MLLKPIILVVLIKLTTLYTFRTISFVLFNVSAMISEHYFTKDYLVDFLTRVFSRKLSKFCLMEDNVIKLVISRKKTSERTFSEHLMYG